MPQSILRALVADDVEGHRLVLREILSSQGVTVDFAMDGRQAVAAARMVAFDLILMDVDMPLMDGLTAAKLIREIEKTTGRPRAKLVMVTARAEAIDQGRSRRAGADDHITKPVEISRIVTLTEDLGRAAAATSMCPGDVRSGPRAARS